MAYEIRFIVDWVFPKPSLPSRRFPMFAFRCRQPITAPVIRRTHGAHPAFDHIPTRRIVRIAGRQSPDTVQVNGKPYPGVNRERPIFTQPRDGIASRRVNRVVAQNRMASIGDDRGEVTSPGGTGAAVSRHGLRIPSQFGVMLAEGRTKRVHSLPIQRCIPRGHRKRAYPTRFQAFHRRTNAGPSCDRGTSKTKGTATSPPACSITSSHPSVGTSSH